MDKSVFYSELRRRHSGVFGTSLSKGQTNGIEAVLDEGHRVGSSMVDVAYQLGVVYFETKGRMRPARSKDGMRKPVKLDETARDVMIHAYASSFAHALRRSRYVAVTPMLPIPVGSGNPPKWVAPVKPSNHWFADMLVKIKTILT